MSQRSASLFGVCCWFGLASCATPGDEAVTASSEQSALLAERAKLSASGRYLAPPSGGGSIAAQAASQASILAALDIPAEFNPRVIELRRAHEDAAFDLAAWGAISPTRGDRFAVLSTGRSAAPTPYAEPGTDLGSPGVESDSTLLRVQLDIPVGVNRLTFDYNFLSTEWPEYVHSAFNDAFTVRITDRNGTRTAIAPVNVDNAAFQPAADTRIGSDPALQFRIYVNDTYGINTENLTGTRVDAGITGYQRVDAAIADNGPLTLEFEIHDVGDGLLDSAVVLDNISFATVELVDPVPPVVRRATPDNLIDPATSRVTTDVAKLLSGGRPARAVVADGTTQLLLRSALPGPGAARFEVLTPGGDVGDLSAHSAALAWRASIEVSSVEQNGKHYAFALYRAPANFVRAGVPEDAQRPAREIELRMTYVPTGLVRSAYLDVMRRPVVVIHNLWSNCNYWRRSQLWPVVGSATNFLNATCLPYDPAKGLVANDQLVRASIDDVYRINRENNIATTQVDLIGHGLGGLLARRYLQSAEYRTPYDFGAGDVNRFIAMNTTHRGSRMACELTNLREYLQGLNQWNPRDRPDLSIKLKLQDAGIFIDDDTADLALDELRLDSPLIAGLQPLAVPTHVLTSSGALGFTAFPPTNIQILLTDVLFNVTTLYTTLVNSSQRTAGLTSTQRRTALYGNRSLFFCNAGACNAATDDHDLFATIVEQRGGLSGARATAFPVALGQDNSGHIRVNLNPPQSTELARLLAARLEDGEFTTAADPLPAPGAQACPTTSLAQQMPSLAALAPISDNLRIAGPPPGATVAPGVTVPLTLTGVNGFVPEEVFVFAPGISANLYEAPFTYDLVVPREAAGELNINAMAIGADGSIAFAPVLTLNVASTATLVSLQILSNDIFLKRPGSTRQLTVMGTYSDGAIRDVTATSKGTRYTISNAGASPLVSVSATGLVTARLPGDATITASQGNRLTSIGVKIGAPACGDGVVDPGEECDDGNFDDLDKCSLSCRLNNHAPQAVCESRAVCNAPGVCAAEVSGLGAGSTDPEGDLLSFAQLPAGPYAVGQHGVTVQVSDGELMATCQAAVTVNDCEPPSLVCPPAKIAECTGGGHATLDLGRATVTDQCAGSSVTAPGPRSYALGTTPVIYTASDAAGNQASCSSQVTVRDTKAPTATASGTPPLWPPDHGYRVVHLADCHIEVTDRCTGVLPPSVHQAQVNCVTSDEDDDAPGAGDGDTTNDIVVIDGQTVMLRAEQDEGGDGRLYNIYFKIRDEAGNVRNGVCPVEVRGADCQQCPPVDSGGKHSVCL